MACQVRYEWVGTGLLFERAVICVRDFRKTCRCECPDMRALFAAGTRPRPESRAKSCQNRLPGSKPTPSLQRSVTVSVPKAGFTSGASFVPSYGKQALKKLKKSASFQLPRREEETDGLLAASRSVQAASDGMVVNARSASLSSGAGCSGLLDA